jgi:small subunit ribosomal protein S17
MMEAKTKKFKKRLEGVVTSDKTDKTIVVTVQRRFKHPKYSKFLFKSAKYHAHDEKNEAKVGDKVTIIESRPYSKMKNWELYKQS